MSKLELYGSDSHCCGRPSQIVISRDGGFVSQNCTDCGRSRKIRLAELPDLVCKMCRRPMEKYVNSNKNYAYRCSACVRGVELCSIVPHWSEEFRYCGLAIDHEE